MAKKPLLEAEIVIDEKSLKALQKSIPKVLDIVSTKTVERLMDKLEELTSITKYTQTAHPRKPEGSTYHRTFQLQRSSQKQIVRNTLPVEGLWEAKAKYASRVIGFAADQAPIHQGRWRIFEGAIIGLKRLDQRIFDEEIERLK